MRKLIQGIMDFRKNRRPGYKETFARLALGQSPDALFIACSDSRVAANLFASTEPGDLFVLRNVGNLIPRANDQGVPDRDSSVAAAIEFASIGLKVRDIVVCGHSECGAMKALVEQRTLPPALQAWLSHAKEPLRRLEAGIRMKADLAPHNHLSQLNVLQQLEHLRSYPIIRERLDSGTLRLNAWWFDIAQAEVSAYEESAGRFVVIDEAEGARLL
ncbi:MAG TPA: carbonic anhydrase, partial [Planctomycetota bacterium]|nr:carbonic anhydrase [Planctomycetota bacterium]